jgi:Resolvase, N terminal domain
MRKAAVYLRVSTQDQTTANQERELRAVAERMGCEVTIYRAAPRAGTSDRRSISCVKMPLGASSIWSWRGRSTGSGGRCKIL